MAIILLAVSVAASTVGAICGIGGGVLVKPVLDLLGIASVSVASFMSGCSVLCMSLYSVIRATLAGDKLIKFKTGTPLAAGAAIGGVVGKIIFDLVKSASPSPERVGGWQNVCLAIVCTATLIYNLLSSKIKTLSLCDIFSCTAIGLVLGIMSSFLGIGGGPINLVVLGYFFSMDTKTAAQNSLYVIVFSQAASLIFTLIKSGWPDVRLVWLAIMTAGGICGGIIGRALNKKMSAEQVKKLFSVLIVIIILVSIFNALRFF